MHILVSALVYYLVGSVIAGSVMGGGFATNLSGDPNEQQLKSLQKIGTYIPLQVPGVDGGLIAQPTQRRPTIVYVHGRSANRMELLPLAQALFKEGYNAVLWDSKSRQISYGPKEIDQVHRIVESIRNDPHVAINEVYIIGFSLGAAIAIGAASMDRDEHIRGIVADSPYADLRGVASRYVTAFGVIPGPVAWPARTTTFTSAKAIHGIEFEKLNPADWAGHIACPVLLIHGKSDRRIPHSHSAEILERLGTHGELWLVEGVGHTKAFSNSPTEYVTRVAAFLNRTGAAGQGTNP
jgi:alpha-beta hydrolase superfamily lysophospholipase